MLVILIFAIAVLSLFGFGQLIGARNKEKNISRKLLERLQGENRKKWRLPWSEKTRSEKMLDILRRKKF